MYKKIIIACILASTAILANNQVSSKITNDNLKSSCGYLKSELCWPGNQHWKMLIEKIIKPILPLFEYEKNSEIKECKLVLKILKILFICKFR